MSKRASLTQSNTLLNYFQSPKSATKKSEEKKTPNPTKAKMEVDENKGESDDDTPQIQPKKRSRIMVMDSDSDSENPPTPVRKSKKKKIESESDSSDEDVDSTPKKPKTAMQSFSFAKSSNGTPKGKSAANGTSKISSTPTEESSKWLHERLDFLKPDKIRDINRNRPTDPEYDWRTLYVPEDYLNSLTPAMRQWWVLKSKHMDSVLFFKVGKFYELYHMDATVGVNHLGFSYMKGDFAHSGFPESAYGRMAASLIEQGFKVARVEQTETPDMMNERIKTQNRKAGKYDKVVKREICQISLKGACIYGAQLADAKQDLPCYMLAIAEKFNKISNSEKRYGVCFVDTSIGIFHLAEFDDDRHSSRLLALLAHHPPALILTERNKRSNDTTDLLKNLTNVKVEQLSAETQFFGTTKTVETLMKECYFLDKNEEFHWPPVLKDIIEDGAAKPGYELSISALGASLWYLKDCELDIQVFSMGKFEFYEPLDTFTKQTAIKRDTMVLDSVTVDNLKLLGGQGTLMKTIDYCCTGFGKRLLQQWICRPNCDVEKIKDRQDAVKELYENYSLLERVRTEILAKLPDLERQISKIHTFGNRFCSKYHPDSRAVLYELQTYSKRKILDLLSTLSGFEKTQKIPEIFEGCQSRLLRKLTQFEPEGMLKDLSQVLQFFKDAFDQNQAEKEGKIIPQKGIDQEYDDAMDAIEEIKKESQEYLKEQCKFFGCQVNYFGTDKKRFQLEVPENKCHKVNLEYQLEGTKKGSKPSKRYSTATTKDILARLMKAEAECSKIVQDLNRRIFEKFSERYEEWISVIHCVMMLDVLCSFAEYARTYSHDVCMPTVLPFSDNPIVKIENGRHPCVPNIDSFVPNDTEMGTENHAQIMILTGPNMGGKSTLMRQVALIIVMAQMGCYVPASYCELSAVDRIFTRLGAHDDILKKQSTFLVELSEAASILKHATNQSFVLLDELGRGTSTHDGCAIATAYVEKLTHIKCRCIFSTHYHTLVDSFTERKDIQLGHMACVVENEGHVTDECVTFLYKLGGGVCPKSYGFNVATLAGLPKPIVTRAREIALHLEKIAKNRKAFKNLMCSVNTNDIKMAREVLLSL